MVKRSKILCMTTIARLSTGLENYKGFNNNSFPTREKEIIREIMCI